MTNYHITKTSTVWGLKKEDATRATKVTETKAEILEYINEHNLNISIFGSGDQEYGIYYDFKVVRGFNEILYETFDKNSRIEGVLECFEWIKNKKLIEGIK